MTTDLLDLPPITGLPTDAASRAVMAQAEPAALDLAKVDLTDAALAKFGDWRKATADTKADFSKLALDLSTQSRIDDAISLRHRKVNAPLAEARRVSKALKAKLADVSKAVGTELELIETAWTDVATAITPQIEAAQKKIDDAKAAAKVAEEARLSALRTQVDDILERWAQCCKVEGITAERIGLGIQMLQEGEMLPELAEVSVYWDTNKAVTLAEMRGMQSASLAREEAARLEAQRVENERVAAENARVAAELKRQAEELEAQRAEQERRAQEDIDAAKAMAAALATPKKDPHGPETSAAGATCAGQASQGEAFAQDRVGELAAGACLGSGVPERGAGVGGAGHGPGVAPEDASQCLGQGDGAGRGLVATAGPEPVAIQACREEDRAMLATPAGSELLRTVAVALDDDLGEPVNTTGEFRDQTEAEIRAANGPEVDLPPVEDDEEDEGGIDALLSDCVDLVALLRKAYDCRFPSHPKPERSWWDDMRWRVENLQPRLAQMVERG